MTELTTIPASVFNTVGVTSPIAGVTRLRPSRSSQPSSATNAAGATVPEVLYMGAEYCPYCAAQRWSTIIALSRFGTWAGSAICRVTPATSIPTRPPLPS